MIFIYFKVISQNYSIYYKKLKPNLIWQLKLRIFSNIPIQQVFNTSGPSTGSSTISQNFILSYFSSSTT